MSKLSKRPPPKASKEELVREAEKLLRRGYSHPAEAVRFLLEQFSGWDLEAIIVHLQQPDGKEK